MVKQLLKKFFLFISLGVLAACGGPGLLEYITPSDGYTVHKDISYGPEARQKLDVYVPDNVKVFAPVIVFFYGGSWQYGSKDDYRFAGQAFASKGFVAVIADYRIYPDVSFPVFLQDSAVAFAWVHNHIGDYKGDTKRLFLAGHSAGAYNAMMLTLDERYITAAGGKKEWIAGTIGIAGPYDFLPLTDPNLIKLFSTAKRLEDTQPITYATKKQPPILLLHGDADEDVWLRNSLNLTAKLRKVGSPVDLHQYPGVSHLGIALALADWFRGKAPVLEDVAHFVYTTP